MSAPVVFLSYSHDSDGHSEWVERLASDLRANGVDITLDVWDLKPGQDIGAFMHRGITAAQRVLLVCTDKYVQKAEAGTGGVGYESLIVTAEVVQAIDTMKFIPLLRANAGETKTPRFLGLRKWIDFTEDQRYDASLEELLRELLGAPSKAKPPLGPNPFSSETPAAAAPVRTTGPTGFTSDGKSLLGDAWFEVERAAAMRGLEALKLTAGMEVRFALHSPLNKSQVELLNAVRKSQIETFGWPIGIILDNKAEHTPRPFADGIRAEVSIAKDALYERESYDYWSLRRTGDFYLLQSLFEDMRSEKQVFFNTRIVRATEALLFAHGIYTTLGAAPETRLSARISHHGLAGRQLTSAGPRRYIRARTSHETTATSEVVVALGEIRQTLADSVRRLLEPMFMLFEFAEFQAAVYEDIVRKFEKGEAT